MYSHHDMRVLQVLVATSVTSPRDMTSLDQKLELYGFLATVDHIFGQCNGGFGGYESERLGPGARLVGKTDGPDTSGCVLTTTSANTSSTCPSSTICHRVALVC